MDNEQLTTPQPRLIPDDADADWFKAERDKLLPPENLRRAYELVQAEIQHIERKLKMATARNAVACAKLALIDLEIEEAKRKGLWTDADETEALDG